MGREGKGGREGRKEGRKEGRDRGSKQGRRKTRKVGIGIRKQSLENQYTFMNTYMYMYVVHSSPVNLPTWYLALQCGKWPCLMKQHTFFHSLSIVRVLATTKINTINKVNEIC